MLAFIIVILAIALVASLLLFAKVHSANKQHLTNIDEQNQITDNPVGQCREELTSQKEDIACMNEQVEELGETSNEASLDNSILEHIPFLRKLRAEDIPIFPDDYKSIRYVYSQQEKAHFEIQYNNLHSNEKALSTLRVRLFEQLQASPDKPLLRCSCCNRPILLSGNSGIKGEIVGFRHVGEGNNYTGEHIGENYSLPKQESQQELEITYDLFSTYSSYLDDYLRHQSFLVLPGTTRDYPGDVTFTYEGLKVTVIFVSAGHPLDFIIRRIRTAVDKGFIPIWILSPSYFASTVMSTRDISVFSKGYICTIDNDTIDVFNQTGEPCVYVRDYHENKYTYISLLSFIQDSEKEVKDILANHQIDEGIEVKPVKHKRVSSTARSGSTKKSELDADIARPTNPKSNLERKTKVAYSAIDYWSGKRFHIKGSLFVEKINEGFGIVDLSTHRYPVLPIYENIIISEDKNSAELILNGEVKRTVNI